MTGGNDRGSGTAGEHSDAPSRTETDPARKEQPTLPDGVERPLRGIEALSPGTLDVPDRGVAPAVEDGDASATKQPPFSGFWFEDADIEEVVREDGQVDSQVPTPRGESSRDISLSANASARDAGMPAEYVGPELETAPRFDDDTALDSTTPLEAVLDDSVSEPSVPSAPSLAQLSQQAKPLALDDDELQADTGDLDGELGELLATHGLALGDPPKDLRGEGVIDASGAMSPDQLADAVDDDQTDPQVPSARRISERPPSATASAAVSGALAVDAPEVKADPAGKAASRKKPLESVAPPAVSVTLRPSPRDAESQRHKEGNPRELWLAAAFVVGFAAVAAAVVLVGAGFVDSSANEKVATAVDMTVNAPLARPPSVPVEAAPDEASALAAARTEDAPVADPRASAPLGDQPRSERSDGSSSIEERMRQAAGNSSTPPPERRVVAEEAGVEEVVQKAMVSPFDRDAANSALNAVAANASSCRQAGDPTGQARLTVTFAPSSGRVTQAIVSGKPFQGTATGGCIARIARQATIPPYSGSYTTVTKTISVR